MLRLRIHLEGIMTKSDRALYLACRVIGKSCFESGCPISAKGHETYVGECPFMEIIPTRKQCAIRLMSHYKKQARRTK